jgi:hypothetical protein
MWWHFRFLFSQTVFLNCLIECQTRCLGYSICLGILSISIYIYIFSINLVSQVTLRSSGTDTLYGCHLLRCLYNVLYFL